MRVNFGVLFVAVIVGLLIFSAITNNNAAFEVAGKQAVPTFYVPYWFGSYGGKVMLFTIFALLVWGAARLCDPSRERMTGGQMIAAIIITVLFSTFIISLIDAANHIPTGEEKARYERTRR